MVLGSPVLALLAQTPPKVGEIVLVVASPFSASIDEVMQASAMAEVYPDRAPIGAFVYLDSPHSYAQLFESGAWLVLSGERILELC